MNIQIIELQQGTQAWLEHRTRHYNASDASAALGLSRYKTRQQLLREKATGIVPEIDEATQRRFDRGHEFEAIARPWAEEIIGAELYPVVLAGDVDGLPLSASLDGLTMLEDVAFEHKSGNGGLLASLEAGVIPDEYKPQMEQCLLLSGATKCLFMASSGDRDAMRFAWYESDPVVRKKLLAGWAMFQADLSEYQHVEQHVEQTVAPVAAPIEALPALAVTVAGSISLTHNLDRFGKRLTEFVGSLNSKPETDQDFADLDAAVKVLKEAEAALDAAEKNALAQTTTIADMCGLVEMYRKVARDNRLMFEKIVKHEKENRKNEIVTKAMHTLTEHVAGLNKRIGGQWVPPMNGLRFSDAVKGLKSLDSMRDKVSTALANAKIEANEIADLISANRLEMIGELDWSFLFPDFAAVGTKARDDFDAMLMARIAKHNEAQAAKDKAAKDAEDARVAAAVEAERKAGEARAAAEAAKLTANNQTQFEDQRGKTEDATHAVQQATELPQAPAASTPPINHFAGAGKMIDAPSMITEFLALQSCSPAAKKEMRAAIEKWEMYRVKMTAARGLEAAA